MPGLEPVSFAPKANTLANWATSWLAFLLKAGIEPATFFFSGKRSTTKLFEYEGKKQSNKHKIFSERLEPSS